MREDDCSVLLQWALPRLRLRWAGFRKVRRQVCKRLGRRLDELELETLEQYRGRLESDSGEWGVLDGLCRITISRLYRDRAVFDAIGGLVLPECRETASHEARPVRCWCAGCASGEEVYTLKILWDLEVQPKGTPVGVEVIGTDADPVVLQRALRGCFSRSTLQEAPARWLDLAFDLRDQDWCVRSVHREGVAFERQDIRSEIPAGPFDLILCRNLVFTYFDAELQGAILDRIAASLREGGYLVIGAHEQLPNVGQRFESVAGSREIFRRVGRAAHRSSGSGDSGSHPVGSSSSVRVRKSSQRPSR
jgi:chemotaxis protein methyltransferase CheR